MTWSMPKCQLIENHFKLSKCNDYSTKIQTTFSNQLNYGKLYYNIVTRDWNYTEVNLSLSCSLTGTWRKKMIYIEYYLMVIRFL